ncbi:Tumor necrosis factor receptor superfamily member 6, partial [Galemys pyrenaicus]
IRAEAGAVSEKEWPRQRLGEDTGKRKVADCTENEGKPTCESCAEGQEYTEVENYSTKCRRCRTCDVEHGLEIEENCTQTQNTKCRCKANFFCENSACEHCNPCTVLVRQRADDQPIEGSVGYGLRPESVRNFFDLSDLCKKCRDRKKGHHEFASPNSVSVENYISFLKVETLLTDLTDIDLSKYIPTIAEQMTITQVKEFVRKNGVSETRIDEIRNDNIHDTAEQKVQLLRNWYQIHGKKEAYKTLIKSLKKAQLCSPAEKIHELISKDIASECENANFKNDHERQNLV